MTGTQQLLLCEPDAFRGRFVLTVYNSLTFVQWSLVVLL